MKRFTLIFLSCIIFLTSCGKVIEEGSGVLSDFSDNTLAEESSQPEVLPPPTSVFSETSVPSNKKYTAVTDGAEYTVSKPADDNYPDVYSSELTDGIYDDSVTSYLHSTLSGFAIGSVSLIIDLGDYKRNIHTFQASVYLDSNAGISSNLKVIAFCSLNGKKWEQIGELEYLEPITLGKVNICRLQTEKYLNARYVRFAVTGDNSWIFLQELTAFADEEQSTQTTYVQGLNDAYSKLGTVNYQPNGKDVDFSLSKINIAKDKRYKIDTPRNKKYIDVDGKMLTDGKAQNVFAENNWVGFDGGKDISVVIDLDEYITDIQSIEVSFYTNVISKNYLPAAVSFNALDNDKNTTPLGIVYGSKSVENGNYKFTVTFPKTVGARYVEVIFHTIPDSLVLVEEISVFAYREAPLNELYPPVKIDTTANINPNPDTNYKNLILSKPCQIHTAVNILENYKENNSPITDKSFTDGVFSQEFNIHNGKYFKFYLGEQRNVIFDLEYVSSVDKFTASFCHQISWAIYAPDVIKIYVSDDCETWYEIGDMTPNESEYDGILKYELTLKQSIKARYVAFSFGIDHCWSGCDELQVFGTESAENAASPDDLGYKKAYKANENNKRKEPSQDLLGGAKQLCLLYHSKNTVAYNVEDLIPYLAYVNENGEIIDTMFDSFLFLHNVGEMPSGGSPYSNSTLNDWYWSVDDLFTQGENVYALEEAAGKVKSKLKLDDDFTYKVAMTIYYPPVAKCENFGDIDGDGENDDFTIYKNRIKAISDYIDHIEERFEKANFKNIELVGYYWWHEDISSTPEDDIKDLLNDISDYVHLKGKSFFWIPYFTASGFSQWDEYGFDIACMQPNYVFSGERPFSNLINNEKYTRLYGMGVEMEIFEDCLFDPIYFNRYMQYIAVGVESGYMTDTVNMYYQSYYVFRDAANSKTLMGRTVYDTTYEYIKGKVKYKPQQIENLSLNIQANTPTDYKIEFQTQKPRKFEIISMSENCSVTFNNDETITIYPQHDFTGETQFTLRYSEYLGWSDEVTVTITVS